MPQSMSAGEGFDLLQQNILQNIYCQVENTQMLFGLLVARQVAMVEADSAPISGGQGIYFTLGV